MLTIGFSQTFLNTIFSNFQNFSSFLFRFISINIITIFIVNLYRS